MIHDAIGLEIFTRTISHIYPGHRLGRFNGFDQEFKRLQLFRASSTLLTGW